VTRSAGRPERARAVKESDPRLRAIRRLRAWIKALERRGQRAAQWAGRGFSYHAPTPARLVRGLASRHEQVSRQLVLQKVNHGFQRLSGVPTNGRRPRYSRMPHPPIAESWPGAGVRRRLGLPLACASGAVASAQP